MVKERSGEGSPLVHDQRITVEAEVAEVTGAEPEIDDLPGIARDPAAFEVFYRLHVVTVTRFVARRVSVRTRSRT
jgi:hypothetical protein